jgi:hypothetical protein
MEKIIIHPAYFPNIIQFSHIVYADDVLFEVNDFYEKQTYRSRMYIQSPNGKQALSVPVKHTKSDGKQYFKDVKISPDFPWRKLHWRSLETAYRTSPYFEFYEDEIKPLLFNDLHKLVDINLTIIHKLLNIIGADRKTNMTQSYKESYDDYNDLRQLKNAKVDLPIAKELPPYTQIFSDRFDFMPNLSFLDLLFMEGPNSISYLEKVYELTQEL